MDLTQQNLVRIEYKNDNKLLSKVYLDGKVFQELRGPWNDALVIKLLGKSIGYGMMKVWNLKRGFDIMDVDNGFFMVKFDLAMTNVVKLLLLQVLT